MPESRRVRMTKEMLKQSMLELLEKEALEKITVTDICKKADVNRSTFYAYYEDTTSLLLEIETDVLNQLPALPDISAACSDENFLIALEAFFDYVRKNERLFRILIIQRDSSSFNHRLVNTVIERYKKPSIYGDELHNRFSYVYCVNGVIGIMKEWINGNFPISTRDFSEIVLQMSAKATS